MDSSTNASRPPRVLILGAGFGGLYAARALGNANVSVTLVDRKNHHTFQPLLYQVATAGLSPGDIAMPIRQVLRSYPNISVFMAEAQSFDLQNKRVHFKQAAIDVEYDYLIIATGATHSYFSHPEWEPWAPGLKTVEDALEIRRRILLAFEDAERKQAIRNLEDEDAATARTRAGVNLAGENLTMPSLNFVIVGAGPTGVELAGAIAEISRRVLAHDFRNIDPASARVLLVEGTERVLPSYPPDLSRKAEEQLRKLGVEVRTGIMVSKVQPHEVTVGDEIIPASLVLWAAGVKASPLGAALSVPLDRAGRVIVQPDCSLAGHPEVFVIGDLAACAGEDGTPLPGLAPVAMQMGRAAAANIRRDLKKQPRKNFHYFDKGTMATIGRAAAVGMSGKIHFSGFIAWMAWLFIHIMYLIGFRNRVLVMMQWMWAYLRFESAARLITGKATET